MNKDNAKDFIPIVQELSEGKTIQYNTGTIESPSWTDVADTVFCGSISEYRIKPAPREWRVMVLARHEIYSLAENEVCPRGEVIRVREVIE